MSEIVKATFILAAATLLTYGLSEYFSPYCSGV